MFTALHLINDLQLLGFPVKNQGSSSPAFGPPGVQQQSGPGSAAAPAMFEEAVEKQKKHLACQVLCIKVKSPAFVPSGVRQQGGLRSAASPKKGLGKESSSRMALEIRSQAASGP